MSKVITIHQKATINHMEKEVRVSLGNGLGFFVSNGWDMDAPVNFDLSPEAAIKVANAIYEVAGFNRAPVPTPTPTKPKSGQAYLGNGKHEWELVTQDEETPAQTQRLRVPGGWLYTAFCTDEDDTHLGVNTVFVPMPEVVKHKV